MDTDVTANEDDNNQAKGMHDFLRLTQLTDFFKGMFRRSKNSQEQDQFVDAASDDFKQAKDEFEFEADVPEPASVNAIVNDDNDDVYNDDNDDMYENVDLEEVRKYKAAQHSESLVTYAC